MSKGEGKERLTLFVAPYSTEYEGDRASGS